MKNSITIFAMLILAVASVKAQNESQQKNNENALQASAIIHKAEVNQSNFKPAYIEPIPEVSVNQNNNIRCFIPVESEWVFVSVFNADGIEILTSCLISKGMVEIPLDAKSLRPGNYSCSLMIDGKTIDTKKLQITL